MIDPYVLLTPILMLAVLALVRFVGCDRVFGIIEVPPTVPDPESPPTVLEATPADQRVDLTWDYPTGKATNFQIWYGEQMGGPYPTGPRDAAPSATTKHGAPVSPLTNGTTYYFKVMAFTAQGSSVLEECNEASATPGVTNFLVEKVLGAPRNNFDGWVGMAIQVRSNPVTVTQLGRWTTFGSSMSHTVRIVDPGQGNTDIGSVDVPLGPPDAFSFAPLPTPVTLLANRLYYIVSREIDGGDNFRDQPTVVEPTGESTNTHVATVEFAVFSFAAAPNTFSPVGTQNQVYGPLNFRY